ncbi:hypothetical protein GGS23DRAFT_595682 [Durotheca rogersii]|uniref:uncharacterized protein n=1 Tax=Durotheca rogersii TaxID=419775 RepID=UPI00221F0982|nr:uncharacterized protein GGS23DRAFT_595682 [Durotheca rogersii]KAI5864030.1 hypothetical protein GGS23DRAFT_595682 [Durotheca rogersii]
MPLHLLGKKSWNVYNPKNIERVRRDEADARAREEAEEQRQQEIDAERRLAILRGEDPPPLPLPPTRATTDEALGQKRDHDDKTPVAGSLGGRERRKRKRAGEDDTDFEMRLAREQVGGAPTADHAVPAKSVSSSDAPLVGPTGHIDLFPDERARPIAQKDEAEAERKKRESEDMYTMRFSNAAGKDGLAGPWYAKGGGVGVGTITDIAAANLEAPSKDVWGNEDPRRKERTAARLVADDPLAMMKRGAAKVREVEAERKKSNREKERELRQLLKQQRHERKRRREEGSDEHDSLEGFSLEDAKANHHHRRKQSRDDKDDGVDENDRRKRRYDRRSRDENKQSQHRSEPREERRHDDRQRSSRDDSWTRDLDRDREKHRSVYDRRRANMTDNW